MPTETMPFGVSGPAGFSPDSPTAFAVERMDDGGPAFPVPDGGASLVTHPFGFAQAVPTLHPGMTLRDWLAGQAVSGAMVGRAHEAFFNPARCAEFARAAYGVADAMLAARKGGAL